MAATATRRGTKAAAPVEEVVEDDDEFEDMDEVEDDDDLEEVDEEPAEEPEAPKKKRGGNPEALAAARAKREATAPKFGSAQLAAHITEQTGETYDARGVRMLLRKLASDGKLDRVVGETRDRYSFSGPEDPTVQAVVAMVQDGTAKALKQAGLDKVKEQAAAKKAAKAAAKQAAEAEEVEEADEDEVEEAPAPKPTRTRRAAPAKAAPAKAAPRKATPRAAK